MIIPALTISTFGTFTIERDGIPIRGLASQKAAALLVYLACTRQPQSRDVLVDLLWDDLPSQRARGNLSVLLTSLRRTVGAYLRIDQTTVTFNAALQHMVDAVELETQLQHAHVLTSEPLDRARAEALEQALMLYHGDFLQGFALRDGRGFEAWTLNQQERFRDMVSAARRVLIATYLRYGDYAAGIIQARALLQINAFDEDAHRQLMLLLAYNGQRGAALAQYATCQHLLRDELGVQPDGATTALFEQIRNTLVTAPPHRQQPIVSSAQHAPFSLPAELTPLIGRTRELERVVELIQRGNDRLVTLVGQGGIGKTRLALAAATQLRHVFADGVWWVPLVGIDAPQHAHATVVAASAIAAAITGALGLALAGTEDTTTQCMRALQHKTLLLVCDNVEHLLAGVAFLEELLRAAPAVSVLVTSRERLSLAAERVVHVEGLPLSPDDSQHTMAAYASVALFLERAERVANNFGRDEATLRAVARLCRVLDGIPLGIELAAQWVAHYSCDEIAQAITADLDFLTTPARGYPERHRSMRGVFRYSWNLLSEEERQVCARLSVFRGPIDRAAASSVISIAVPDEHAGSLTLRHAKLAVVLASLVDKSLLRRIGTDRYSMHELLRQFAAERLAHDPQAHASTLDRHATYCLHWVAARTTELVSPYRQTMLRAIEANGENIYAAWHWAAAQRQATLIGHSVAAVCSFYQELGRYQEGEAICDLVIAQFNQLQAAADGASVLGHVLAWKAAFATARSQLPAARTLLEQSLTLLNTSDVTLARAFALFCRGQIALLGSDLTEAWRWIEESLTLYQAQHDQVGTARASSVLGRIAWLKGDYVAAQQRYQSCLALYRTLGYQAGIAHTLGDVAMVTVLSGKVDEGVRMLHESRALAQELDDQPEIARAYRSLAEALLYIGRFAEAQELYQTCVKIDDTFGLALFSAQDRLNLALTHLLLHQYDAVLALGPTTLSLSRAIALHRNVGLMLALLGLAELGRGAYHAARDLLQESLSVYHIASLADDTIITFFGLSQVYRVLGEPEQAREVSVAALQLATKGRGVRAGLLAIGAMVAMYVLENQIETAVELASFVEHHPFGANGGFLKDIVKQPVVAPAAQLPPEIIAAARVRGRARDLAATIAELLAKYAEPQPGPREAGASQTALIA